MPTTVTQKGQITIPKAIWDFLGIGPGDRVSFRRTEQGTIEWVAAGPTHPKFERFRGHADTELTTDQILELIRSP